MAGGPFTQSELHAMLTWARRYQELPARERFAALDDIRRTLQGATRCVPLDPADGACTR